MKKSINYITGVVSGALAVAGWAILNVLIAPALGMWTAVFNIAYILAAAIFVSHYFNMSIPGVRLLLRRAYYRAKYKAGGSAGIKKAKPLKRFYMQFLVYLIWVFKETEEGFDVVKDEAEHYYSQALLLVGMDSDKKKPAKRDLLHLHKKHQNRATALSLTALFVLIIGTVITGLISSFVFPAVFQSQAATYTWTQTDWSGGTSTNVATHPDDTSGWTEYESADSNVMIDGSGNITLASTSQSMIDDESTFNEGNTTYDSYGSIKGPEVQLKIIEVSTSSWSALLLLDHATTSSGCANVCASLGWNYGEDSNGPPGEFWSDIWSTNRMIEIQESNESEWCYNHNPAAESTRTIWHDWDSDGGCSSKREGKLWYWSEFSSYDCAEDALTGGKNILNNNCTSDTGQLQGCACWRQ